MDAEQKKKLLISLIKDDLINAKLVNGLNEIGLEAQNFYLHLNETIFDLMGFEDDDVSDAVYKEYVILTKRAEGIDISESNASLDGLAVEIYEFLLKKAQKK